MQRRFFPSLFVAAVALAIWPILARGAGTSAASRGPLSSNDHSHNVFRRAIEVPNGDPLTAPLAFSAAERRLFIDADDGRLDEHSLIEAALTAGGVSDADAIRAYLDRFASLRAESTHFCNRALTVVAKIEAIHALLHRALLRNYDADATLLAATFDRGDYNCASATLLFTVLAADAGLNARAIELPGHVRAAVSDGRQQWEVEITSPNWNEAIRRMESAADCRDVSPLGLIAMIYYNQGIDAFHARRFAAAIAANRRALLLDPANREAHGNLLASINNWALALCETGQYDAATKLLEKSMDLYGNHTPFRHNARYIKQKQLQLELSVDHTM